MPGPLEPSALERAFNEIIRRHEAWRTTFPTVDGRPITLVHPPARFELPVLDLRDLPEDQRIPAAMRRVFSDIDEPFDLAMGPLLRPRLARLGEQEHWLFLALHHIIYDGFSGQRIFLPELETLYKAYCEGKTSPLPELPVQYGDFAHWQRQWLRDAVPAEQLDYWRKQLTGAPPVLRMPTDRPRSAIRTCRGAMHQFALRPGLTDQLKQLSLAEGVTLYMTLLAVLSTLLYRYTEQDDIVVGSAVAGRKRPETQGMLGFFPNMLVMRTSLAGDPPFRELLARLRDVVLGALAHEDVPFDLLVKELQPERDPSLNPLYQVALALEPPHAVQESGWTLSRMDIDTHTAKVDLTLELDDRPNDEGLVGRFEYNTDLFDAETISRLCDHWLTLLESIVADPACSLSTLPMLTAAERRTVLLEWNATDVPYPADRCIHQLFEEQVRRTPEATAVVFADTHLTYAELNGRANQLAHYLICLGVGPDHFVALCMERSLEALVGLLGILKAGGAYVPLDPSYPRERLAFMLEDTQAQVLVMTRLQAATLPRHTATVVCLDTDRQAIAEQPETNPSSGVSNEHLAYVIYTSGSTGRPKGVLINHRMVVHSTAAMINYYKEPIGGYLLLSSFAFDSSVAGIFWTLSQGGILVLPREGIQDDLPEVIERSSLGRITHLLCVPSLYALILEQARPHQLESLRIVILAGESFRKHVIEPHRRQAPQARLYNEYGPTEATVWCTVHEVDLGNSAAKVPIGRPIANTQIYVLDDHRQPVPVGVSGELYVGGAGVALGYHNRPELTAERFVPNPFIGAPGARLYRTGDLVRRFPNGSLEYLGRLDSQVKLRGFRIELGEIEAALRSLPRVRDAVVLVREDVPGDQRLVAYVVPLDVPPTPDTLRTALRDMLPDYMVPSVFVPLNTFPLTPNGKVDRGALPTPQSPGILTPGHVRPTVTLHHQLTRIWEDLLNVRPIGITDSFFVLGGHSLLAAQMVDRIEQECGKRVPFTALFTEPTIEHLTRVLLRQEGDTPEPRIVALNAGGGKRPFFFLHGDWKGGGLYTVALARRLGDEQPFYVLTPYGVRGNTRIPRSIEEMAAAQLKEVRAIQPRGPYILGGFCADGVVALEMAQQLHAHGERVELLVLLDADPSPRKWWVRRVLEGIGRLARLDADEKLDLYLRLSDYDAGRKVFHSLEHGDKLRLTLNYLRVRGERLTSRFSGDGEKRRDRATQQPAVHRSPRDLDGIYRWVTAAYRPKRYAGRIAHFWADQEYTENKDSIRNVWRTVAPNSEFRVIPGEHLTFITTYGDQLAAAIAGCVEAVQLENYPLS
jgi:aspartate racemase